MNSKGKIGLRIFFLNFITQPDDHLFCPAGLFMMSGGSPKFNVLSESRAGLSISMALVSIDAESNSQKEMAATLEKVRP